MNPPQNQRLQGHGVILKRNTSLWTLVLWKWRTQALMHPKILIWWCAGVWHPSCPAHTPKLGFLPMENTIQKGWFLPKSWPGTTRTQPIFISVPMKFVLGPNNTELQFLSDCNLNRSWFHISIWKVHCKLCAKGILSTIINRNKRASQSWNKAVARKDGGSDLCLLLHLCSPTASSLTMGSKSTLQTSADGRSQSCLLTLEIPSHQWTGITISHHLLTALKLKKPHGEKQQQNPRATSKTKSTGFI